MLVSKVESIEHLHCGTMGASLLRVGFMELEAETSNRVYVSEVRALQCVKVQHVAVLLACNMV